MSSLATADEPRRTSLNAGASRVARFGSHRPRHRDTTKRDVDRRVSAAGLPFDRQTEQAREEEAKEEEEEGDEAADAGEEDVAGDESGAGEAAAESDAAEEKQPTTAAVTPRSKRASSRVPPRSSVVTRTPITSSLPTVRSPATRRSPAAARSPAARSPAAAAASTSAAAQTASPRSPRTPAPADGRRQVTRRENDSRVSLGFSPPFAASAAASRRTSYAASEAPDEDEVEVGPDATTIDFDEFVGGGEGPEYEEDGGHAHDTEEADAAGDASDAVSEAAGDAAAMDASVDASEDGAASAVDDAADAAVADDESASSPSSREKKRKAPPKIGGPRVPRAPGPIGGGRVGRKTMHIVQRAQELGMIDEEHTDVGSGDEGTPRKRRRPTRQRLAPIDWWMTQELNYHRTESGIGATMPIINELEPVVQRAKSPEKKPPRATPKPRPSSKQPKRLLKPSAAEIAAEEAKKDPLPPYITILNTDGVEIQVATLAKNSNDIPMEALGTASAGGPPVPHGGKAFEQPEFSTGILSLPPRAKKMREVANNNEIFYVISAPINGLRMTLHTQSMNLSTGAQFMIPAGNTYELHNTSNTAIKLMFVLVKPTAQWISEFREQQMGLVEEEEEEEEDDEEELPPPRKASKSSSKRR